MSERVDESLPELPILWVAALGFGSKTVGLPALRRASWKNFVCGTDVANEAFLARKSDARRVTRC
jgi:hypothetical protein